MKSAAVNFVPAGPSFMRVALAGAFGGFLGSGFMGAVFSSPPVQSLLYRPDLQSELFRQITPQRNIPVSVGGLVALSIIHSWLFLRLAPAIPGCTWLRKGLAWGAIIWAMYWLFQEWFVYHTLLGEPWFLCLFELTILLGGSLIEGVTIAGILHLGSHAPETVQHATGPR